MITVRVDSALGSITWTDPGNCGGPINNFGSYITYQFEGCENGVISLYIMDDTVDTVDIEVRGTNITSITDDDTEGLLYFYELPLLGVTKSIVSPAQTPQAGDYIRYRIYYSNVGGPATNVRIVDMVPMNTTYSQNSLADGSGTLTDAEADDAGSYTGGGQITFCPGTGGSAPATGGTVAAGASGTFYFTVMVNTNSSGLWYATNTVAITNKDSDRDAELQDSGSFSTDLTAQDMVVGWNTCGRIRYTVLGTGVSSIPDNAEIQNAEFHLYGTVQAGNPGNIDPFDVDYFNIAGATPAANADMYSAAIDPDFTFFTWTGESWYDIPVTDQVQHAVTNSAVNDVFWLRVKPGPCNSGNRLGINSWDKGANVPWLEVTFRTSSGISTFEPDAVTNIVSIAAKSIPLTSYTLVTVVTQYDTSASLSVNKEIYSIELGGVGITTPVPGASVIFRVTYSNIGPSSADNMIIYDQLPEHVIFLSNGPSGAWQEQYSEQTSPDQSYGSGSYLNMPPAISSNVRWIRWINASVPAGTAGSFTYSVIIK
jgi:uncharacterized repeat protein (TIGR01451 family)